MRLPEGKIKEAILHPDPEIRDRATWYFARSFSPDPTIMPLVIRAVETHPKQDAYRLIGLSGGLRQGEDTIAWVIEELNDPQTDQYENYAYNLSMVLVEADPALGCVLATELASCLGVEHDTPRGTGHQLLATDETGA